MIPSPSLSLAPAAASRIELACALVAAAAGIRPPEILAPTRSRAPVAFARQVAMYLGHVALGLSLQEVGRAFGRDRTTAAHACRVVEDRRDDPTFDALLDRLEASLAAAPAGEGGIIARLALPALRAGRRTHAA